MPRRKWRDNTFSERLVAIRKARGLTQVELAKASGCTQRAISYYETQATYPPAPIVAQLARALRVTTDELLGVKSPKGKNGQDRPELRRLWKKFQMVLQLPEKDQRAVLRLIGSILKSHSTPRQSQPHSGPRERAA